MPAHNHENKDRRFQTHILAKEQREITGRAPDGHVDIWFEWQGHTRTWRIEGVLQPESPFLNPKHNTQDFDLGLPKSQGETLIRFLEWIESLLAEETTEGTEQDPASIEE